MRVSVRWGVLVLAMMANACASPEPGVYRGGVLLKGGPLAIENNYSFRFVGKWRISHSWLSGPVEIRPCGYGSGNPFSNRPGFESLALELNAPIFEWQGELIDVGSHYKTKELIFSPMTRERIYGTNREGKFEGYMGFCGHFFEDTLDGIALNIVKPDPAKGTDEWVQGAKSVMVNGQVWLKKAEPIKDWTGSKKLAGPTETWVLKIPDTKYWLRLRLSSSTGATSEFKRGANAFPEKHQRIVDLFHQIVHSVKLEPITPIDITPLIKEIR